MKWETGTYQWQAGLRVEAETVHDSARRRDEIAHPNAHRPHADGLHFTKKSKGRKAPPPARLEPGGVLGLSRLRRAKLPRRRRRIRQQRRHISNSITLEALIYH